MGLKFGVVRQVQSPDDALGQRPALQDLELGLQELVFAIATGEEPGKLVISAQSSPRIILSDLQVRTGAVDWRSSKRIKRYC